MTHELKRTYHKCKISSRYFDKKKIETVRDREVEIVTAGEEHTVALKEYKDNTLLADHGEKSFPTLGEAIQAAKALNPPDEPEPYLHPDDEELEDDDNE